MQHIGCTYPTQSKLPNVCSLQCGLKLSPFWHVASWQRAAAQCNCTALQGRNQHADGSRPVQLYRQLSKNLSTLALLPFRRNSLKVSMSLSIAKVPLRQALPEMHEWPLSNHWLALVALVLKHVHSMCIMHVSGMHIHICHQADLPTGCCVVQYLMVWHVRWCGTSDSVAHNC